MRNYLRPLTIGLQLLLFGPFSCGAPLDERGAITFYAYTPRLGGLAAITRQPGESEDAWTERAIEAQFLEIKGHLGSSSSYGRVGIGLNYPYTVFLEGAGPDHFRIRKNTARLYELNVKVARKLGMPVLVGLNGADWAGAQGPFNAYWKTAEGGKYLSRYQDGRVNESLPICWDSIPSATLEGFLDRNPYDRDHGKDALILTKSPDAKPLQSARLKVLQLALDFWSGLDREYPGTIDSFTTDSEVASWSFRETRDSRALGIGFEDFMILAYCRESGIRSCRDYMASRHFDYASEEDRRWFRFRARVHRAFVQSSVNTIRATFPSREIFTHQLVTLDGEYLFPYKAHDWASPQETAFVNGADPAFTFYIHQGQDKYFKALVTQFSSRAKAANRAWGIMEFHPGKTWSGTTRRAAGLYPRHPDVLAGERCLRAWIAGVGKYASRSRLERLGC